MLIDNGSEGGGWPRARARWITVVNVAPSVSTGDKNRRNSNEFNAEYCPQGDQGSQQL